MKVFNCYYRGIKEAAIQYKMIFVLWLVYFLFGLILFLLMFSLLSQTIGKSILAENLLKRFDFKLLLEFLIQNVGQVQFIIYLSFILMVIYILISTFLNGGILFTLTHCRRKNYFENKRERLAQVFFHGAGKFFGRFFRLLIYSMVLWIFLVILFFIITIIGKILSSNGANEKISFYFFWIKLVISVFVFFLIKMILDYTCIKIIVEDSRFVFRSLLKTIKFVFKNLGKTLALYYLLVLTGIIILLLYLILNSIIPQYSFATVLIIFIIQQFFILSRAWLKIAFMASQLLFYSPEHFLNGKFPLI